MLNEFKTFIARGNVLDLAVGVIIGAAFGKIVTSLTDDVIMPVIGKLTGGMDFTNQFVMLGSAPAGYTGSLTDYAALKAAGVPLLGYGAFITAVINFLIIAWVVFLLVKGMNRLRTVVDTSEKAPEAPAGPTQEEVLIEIRDLLKARADALPPAPPPGPNVP